MGKVPKFNKDDYRTAFGYDLHNLAFDMWKTGFYSNKLDLLAAMMSVGKGCFYNTIVLTVIEEVLTNIDYYKDMYSRGIDKSQNEKER